MERLKFIGKRLVYLVIMLFGVATLVFILTKLVPGDPVTANLSQRALGDPQIVAAYKAKYGNDYPSIIGVALLIALNYMIINTVVDILYGIIDPRVRCS